MKAYICGNCKQQVVVIGNAKPYCSKCRLEMFEDIQSEFNKPDVKDIPKKRKKRIKNCNKRERRKAKRKDESKR